RQDRFLIGAVSGADPWRPGTVVAREQAALALPTGPFAREHERTGIVVDRRVRLRRRQVRILIVARPRRLRELIAQTIVEDELVVHAPVVLRVEAVVRINLLEVADGLG